MMIRTTEKMVKFARPFTLIDEARPTKRYRVSAVRMETPAGTITACMAEADHQALDRAENEGMAAPHS